MNVGVIITFVVVVAGLVFVAYGLIRRSPTSTTTTATSSTRRTWTDVRTGSRLISGRTEQVLIAAQGAKSIILTFCPRGVTGLDPVCSPLRQR